MLPGFQTRDRTPYVKPKTAFPALKKQELPVSHSKKEESGPSLLGLGQYASDSEEDDVVAATANTEKGEAQFAGEEDPVEATQEHEGPRQRGWTNYTAVAPPSCLKEQEDNVTTWRRRPVTAVGIFRKETVAHASSEREAKESPAGLGLHEPPMKRRKAPKAEASELRFCPPQLRKPNIVTEDTSAWSRSVPPKRRTSTGQIQNSSSSS